jgi:hypothetical protein
MVKAPGTIDTFELGVDPLGDPGAGPAVGPGEEEGLVGDEYEPPQAEASISNSAMAKGRVCIVRPSFPTLRSARPLPTALRPFCGSFLPDGRRGVYGRRTRLPKAKIGRPGGGYRRKGQPAHQLALETWQGA